VASRTPGFLTVPTGLLLSSKGEANDAEPPTVSSQRTWLDGTAQSRHLKGGIHMAKKKVAKKKAAKKKVAKKAVKKAVKKAAKKR
jgi:hypothetical protein